MKVVAGVLTWNPIENDRLALLEKTVGSLTCDVVVFDNGSTDGFQNHPLDVPVVRIPKLPGFPHGNTCGYGMNKIAATLNADLVILSNDDIIWHADAIPTLKAVWGAAPDELAIVSGLVEPTYALPSQEPWNQPLGVIEVAGRRLLSRRSVPGGAWTFRHKTMFPVSTFPGVDDVPACQKLVAEGSVVACMDLADHEGDQSTWGNGSDRFIVQTRGEVWGQYGV